MPLNDDTQVGLAHRFSLKIIGNDEIDLGSWNKVEGLNVTWEVAEYRAGDAGNERWFYPGFTKYQNVKFSRIADGDATPKVKTFLEESSFWTGTAGYYEAKVTLNDAKNEEVMAWDLKKVMPVNWAVVGFDATSSKPAIETLELTHLGFLDDENVIAS